MEALFYSLEVFYKHVGCSNAELFKEVSSFVSSIGEMLVGALKHANLWNLLTVMDLKLLVKVILFILSK